MLNQVTSDESESLNRKLQQMMQELSSLCKQLDKQKKKLEDEKSDQDKLLKRMIVKEDERLNYEKEQERMKKEWDDKENECEQLSLELLQIKFILQKTLGYDPVEPNLIILYIRSGLNVVDPVMTKDVYRIKLQFEDHKSENFNSIFLFNKTRTVRYQKNGELGIGQSIQGIIGNQMYKCGQIVSADVDFEAVPLTINFYVDDPEQPIYIRNVPKSIRFYI
ncbi:MAG: hypothetical protein EZS28_029984 [Streblomastix strix]|uniref:Uncharacterized protein n=1 Tax=Streblomastix strix TaxID=222440 RepID=A0A5J4UVI5_9EUKA|nr:MAG: hypothetical protein EZS28_029984 [Streblomastix strix]